MDNSRQSVLDSRSSNESIIQNMVELCAPNSRFYETDRRNSGGLSLYPFMVCILKVKAKVKKGGITMVNTRLISRYDTMYLAEDLIKEHTFVEADEAIKKAIESGIDVNEINDWFDSNYLRGLYRADKQTGLLAPSTKVLSENPDIGLSDLIRDMSYIRDTWLDKVEEIAQNRVNFEIDIER